MVCLLKYCNLTKKGESRLLGTLLGIIMGTVYFFFVFYLLNYIGQKLISKKSPVNHKVIVSISFVEAFVALLMVYYKPPFL